MQTGLGAPRPYRGFPTGDQALDPGLVRAAMDREGVPFGKGDAVIGVAPAMYGEDGGHAVAVRIGLDGYSIRTEQFAMLGETVDRVSDLVGMTGLTVDSIVVDPTGVGAGLVDMLRGRGLAVIECPWKGRPESTVLYRDRGAELCLRFRKWAERGALSADVVTEGDIETLRVQSNRDGKVETPPNFGMLGLPSGVVRPHPRAQAFALTFGGTRHRAEWGG